MKNQQRQQYNKLLYRRAQLANFIFLAELPLISNGVDGLCSIKEFLMIDAATDLAYKTVLEIDNEIEKLLKDE